jgi:hypothetical protein
MKILCISKREDNFWKGNWNLEECFEKEDENVDFERLSTLEDFVILSLSLRIKAGFPHFTTLFFHYTFQRDIHKIPLRRLSSSPF